MLGRVKVHIENLLKIHKEKEKGIKHGTKKEKEKEKKQKKEKRDKRVIKKI